jgi:hypothetical protein
VHCDKDSVCLETTRKTLLDEIKKWALDPDAERIFWLHGAAGSGKSTVANTIAKWLRVEGFLGASFSFDRDTIGRNEPTFLFRNMAYQLSNFNERYKECLMQAIAQHGKMHPHRLRQQLKIFIVDPMVKANINTPVVIVIDALDEVVVGKQEMVEAQAKEMSRFPRFVKVLLTSRDEPGLHAKLDDKSLHRSINEVQGTADDIVAYTRNRMQNIISEGWLAEEDLRILQSRADGLFLWITIVSNYIRDSVDPRVALHSVLSGERPHSGQQSPEETLDQLFLGILQRTPELSYSYEATRYVIGSILVAETPLTLTGLDALLGLCGDCVKKPIVLRDRSEIYLTSSKQIISMLGSILRIDGDSVRVLHMSVVDFFTTRSRCTNERLFIDRSKHNGELASRCFETMKKALRRDICRINDPTKLNSDIPDERLE